MEALIMLIIFSPALAFFAGRTFLKYQELRLKAGAPDSSTTRQLAARLEAVEAENHELKQRVETLETIATGGDPRTTGLEGAQKLKELEEQVRAEAKRR
jgi:hypothetical protein